MSDLADTKPAVAGPLAGLATEPSAIHQEEEPDQIQMMALTTALKGMGLDVLEHVHHAVDLAQEMLGGEALAPILAAANNINPAHLLDPALAYLASSTPDKKLDEEENLKLQKKSAFRFSEPNAVPRRM